MYGDPNENLKDMMVLDVGTGEGNSCRLLNRKGSFVISLDSEREMLQAGLKKKKIPRGQAVLADARHLPFKDGSFDLVSSRYFLHYVTAHAKYLQEMKRTMKPKGKIQLIDICAPVLEIKEFLEKCHFEEPPPLKDRGILTKEELLYQLTRLRFHVRSIEWSTFKEKESSRKLKRYIAKEIMRNPALKEHIKIRKGKRNLYVHLPVVTIRGDKGI